MTETENPNFNLTPDILLKAYSCGIFPMAESATDPNLFWIEPEKRGIIPLDKIHISRSLRKLIRSNRFDIRVNSDFKAVIEGCAEAKTGREETWINPTIVELYGKLFENNYCHTVEVWRNDKLVGGLYGVHLRGAFFGESMFYRETDASKVALIYLVARLIHGKFKLLDTQFITPHLARLGAIEISQQEYLVLLEEALAISADYSSLAGGATSEEVLQLISQIS